MGKYSLQEKKQLLQYEGSTGWCKGVTRCESPNFNQRPAGCQPELLVVHNISLPPEQFSGEYVQQFFCNSLDAKQDPYFQEIAHLQVSSHFYIRRSGECIQFVSCLNRAWHAGLSSYSGRENCNDFSIGFELEGADNIPYEPNQYVSLAALIAELRENMPLPNDCPIVGHADIAPSRKTDPGSAFDWLRLHALIKCGAK